jgi:hypothetical protein
MARVVKQRHGVLALDRIAEVAHGSIHRRKVPVHHQGGGEPEGLERGGYIGGIVHRVLERHVRIVTVANHEGNARFTRDGGCLSCSRSTGKGDQNCQNRAEGGRHTLQKGPHPYSE